MLGQIAGSSLAQKGMTRWLLNGLALLMLVSTTAHAAENDDLATNSKFSRDTVIDLARKLASSAYKPPRADLPESLSNLSNKQYRDIRFDPTKAIWAGQNLPFELELYHRGGIYKDPVEIALVEDGAARHLAYDPAMFKTGENLTTPLPSQDIGFAGFRLKSPLNRPDTYEDTAIFLGATYFRAVAKNQVFGMSARGLAIKTADPEGEEFPIYRAFWIEKPSQDTNSIVINALLDSKSVAGAYRFTIRPGTNTTMDVEATLFPRTDLTKVGLAPETSMYLFSANDRANIDDYRPQVHDSDGLLMLNGRGERLWRPLANPTKLQISAFQDTAPMGFGLMQRARNFVNYQDLDANFQSRPSLWIEPLGNWGKGAVVLTEIPSDAQIHDNTIAYWAPGTPIKAGTSFNYSYRLSWGTGPTIAPGEARVYSTRSGRVNPTQQDNKRTFVVDYTIPDQSVPMPQTLPHATVKSSQGNISNVSVRENPQTGGYRVTFQMDPGGAELAELRLELKFDDARKAETWMYRWTN
ncbi:glucan biosynthesis protein [Pokkaliibacter sp. CJK22405]|uniref:glucan biosynthesis protein n=1 Tax=Pokkaliibacter sp. CJK22405 TaxID=3384615 RepID=UPI003984BF35